MQISKELQALLRIKSLKVGDTVEDKDIEAIRVWLGTLLDKVPEPQELGTITFPEDGPPVMTGIFEGATVTGDLGRNGN